MSVILPSSISYNESLPALPDNTQCINLATAPSNGSSFTPGTQIYIDLVNRGFLIPDSMYLTYSWAMTSGAGAPEMIGCPASSPFQRLDVQVGSQTIDTIQSYNVFYNLLTNLSLDIGMKLGNQASYGYFGNTTPTSLEAVDGRLMITGTDSGSFSFPLISILSNAEKLIPLWAMGQVRLILTMDAINNFFTSSVVPTGFTISNVMLRYKVVDFGAGVEQIVSNSSDKLYIKSQSFSLATQTLTSGTSGSVELVYNLRYASVKSVFAINGTSTAGGNKAFDSCDITGALGGDYSFGLGGQIFPPVAINTKTSKTQALLELKSACGSIFDKSNNMSINSTEFNLTGTTCASTYQSMAKFFVGTSLEKLNSNNLLTGISTQNSPVSYRISIGTATASSVPITLCLNYDALIEVDTQTRQVSIKC